MFSIKSVKYFLLAVNSERSYNLKVMLQTIRSIIYVGLVLNRTICEPM